MTFTVGRITDLGPGEPRKPKLPPASSCTSGGAGWAAVDTPIITTTKTVLYTCGCSVVLPFDAEAAPFACAKCIKPIQRITTVEEYNRPNPMANGARSSRTVPPVVLPLDSDNQSERK